MSRLERNIYLDRNKTNCSYRREADPVRERHAVPACVRYIVDDASAAIEFYTDHLGFELEMHPAPRFAEVSREDLRLYFSQPTDEGGGGAPMPSGERQEPGGWNRIHLVVEDLDSDVADLEAAGCRFRNDVVQDTGGKQILPEDPSGNLVELFQPDTDEYRQPGSGRAATRG